VDETFFIDIWSDVVCPFCYIGSRQLSAALERFEHRDRVVVRHRAFELDPHAAALYEYGLDELVAIKYGLSIERARTLNHRLEDQASRLAMTWSLDRARPTNTFDAHRLLALASVKGVAAALSERLFRAHFSEGRLLSDHVTLSELAGEIGLDGSDELWRGTTYADRVRNDDPARRITAGDRREGTG